MTQQQPIAGFAYERRVEFADTDMAGIAHFSMFFRYMEEAEHAFLRSIEMDVFTALDRDVVSWPRVSARCEFCSPARLGEILSVGVRVKVVGEKSVTYAFEISVAGRLVATGEFVTVCCRIRGADQPRAPSIEAINIPAQIRTKLQPLGS